MYIWRRGTAIERTQSVYLPTKQYIDQLAELRQDDEIPFLADNLVFLTNDSSPDRLDRDILYSILDKRPKRARAYFFLTIQVTDEPYTHEFSVNTFGTDFIFKVQIRLGFCVNQRVNEYLYQIVEKLVQDNMIAPQHHKYSICKKKSSVGDFRFCLVRKVPSSSADISAFDRNIISAKYIIRRICGSPAHWYGLENSSVIFEYVPLFARTKRQHTLDYVELPDALKRAGLAYDEGSDEYAPSTRAAGSSLTTPRSTLTRKRRTSTSSMPPSARPTMMRPATSRTASSVATPQSSAPSQPMTKRTMTPRRTRTSDSV